MHPWVRSPRSQNRQNGSWHFACSIVCQNSTELLVSFTFCTSCRGMQGLDKVLSMQTAFCAINMMLITVIIVLISVKSSLPFLHSWCLRPIAIRVADTFQWNYVNEVHWEIRGITLGSPTKILQLILRNSIWVYLFIFWNRFWDILSEMPDAWKLNSSEMTLVLDDRRWWRSWKLHGDLQGLAKVLKIRRPRNIGDLMEAASRNASCSTFHFILGQIWWKSPPTISGSHLECK